jgi:hypothetical protein
VKVLAITGAQGGGGNVAVCRADDRAPEPAQGSIAEISATPAYRPENLPGAVLTISANPGHTQGMAPNLTASVKVDFVAPFNGPLHHRPLHDLTRPVPRHMYGDVTSIASDNASIMVTKEFPVEPAVSPETAVATTQSLQILADSTNGTIFYDVDAKSHSVIKDFSSESNLPGKSVRIARATRRTARWWLPASGPAAGSTTSSWPVNPAAASTKEPRGFAAAPCPRS